MITGWRKDPYDLKDYLFPAARVIPDTANLGQYLSANRNQNSEGSCVGQGVGTIFDAEANMAGLSVGWFGARWIYNGARALEGNIREDCGCYPRDAFKWVSNKGCLLDRFWPYIAGVDTFVSPSSRLEPEAANWPLLTYYRIVDGIDGICSAISQGHCIALGNPWYDSWMETDRDGRLPEVSGSEYPAGGHETVIYGYDRNRGEFYCRNSWGKEWGNQGNFIMPFSAFAAFKRWGGYDAYYVEVGWGEDTVPQTKDEAIWEAILRWLKSIAARFRD